MGAKKKIFGVHKMDSRELDKMIKGEIVDVTITSPPYFDLKNYGSKKQIGYGQTYQNYLKDLRGVFQSVYECTKDTGSLWVIIDSFRRDGEVVPLPFDFAGEIKKTGWKLQDVIIWVKDRTVPWAHKGQMRSLFEYILVFSKTDDFVFNIDRVRSNKSLKKWWIKYPERYNPNGKTPEAIWNFDIPVQGSWGDGYIRHFCPLPEEMIAQILLITTNENDVVLDPFSGSGAVLSKASAMKRNYIGFELNNNYIKMFKKYLENTGRKKRKIYEKEKSHILERDEFYKLIMNLRALKYARVLAINYKKNDLPLILKIYVGNKHAKTKKRNSLINVEYTLLISNKKNIPRIKKSIENICSKPPLSKFGIDPTIFYVTDKTVFLGKINRQRVFTYTEKSTHRYKESVNKDKAINASCSDLIISGIKVDIDEKEYE